MTNAHGVPCERWLRSLLNRIDPILFNLETAVGDP